MAADVENLKPPGPLKISSQMKTTFAVLMFLGFVAFALALVNDGARAWHGYLTAFFFFVSLALGGLFFAAMQHMTNAGWSVNVRRLAESFAAFMPYAFVGAIALLIGAPKLYSWLDPQVVATDYLVAHKAPYLNQGFLWVRTLFFFGGWLLFAHVLVGRSVDQDKSGDEKLTTSLVPWSIAFVMFFALSYSFFSVDALMSLEPHWFSTIFGVYTFGGLFQSSVAFLILLIVFLQRQGLVTGFITADHLHDLGKFLFAFTVFWAYIAFSQYMLIWYANIPEETLFFVPRSEGPWVWVSLALILFKFVVPFFALLPRWAKRHPAHLSAVSVLILVMQYVDLHWLVFPNFDSSQVVFGLYEIFIFLGFLGLFLFSVTSFLSRHPIVPLKDPRQQESMHHHVVY